MTMIWTICRFFPLPISTCRHPIWVILRFLLNHSDVRWRWLSKGKEPSQKMTQHFRNKACCRTKSWCTFGQISPLHRFYHHSICPSNRPFSETAVPWEGPSRGSDDDVQRTHTVIPLELSGWQLQRVWLTQMWRGSCKNFMKKKGDEYMNIFIKHENMFEYVVGLRWRLKHFEVLGVSIQVCFFFDDFPVPVLFAGQWIEGWPIMNAGCGRGVRVSVPALRLK